MIRVFTFIIVFLLFSTLLTAQKLTQNIRGKVIDSETEYPLVGANVIIFNPNSNSMLKGTTVDLNGYFKLSNVNVGKINLKVSYIGYKSKILRNINLISGKELILTIKLEEKVIELNEVKITANRNKHQPLNKMAVVSARSFTIDETERFAGSLGDPARMATNYAGVRISSDQVNDIIIRGNSPAGLLWKLEGVNIPNPNHFGSMGSTGGPISMLNNNLLANSDFFTSAFPAEYGNALAGVFDLNLRIGNNQKREYTGQFGLNGFELGAEGPFSNKNKKASYLLHYRYNNLDLFNKMGFNFGLTVLPIFQDVNFKLNFPLKNSSQITVFGLGGINSIKADFGNDTIQSEYKIDTKIAILGISYKKYLNPTTRIKTSIASTSQHFLEQDYKIINSTKWGDYVNENFEHKYIFNTDFKKKFSNKNYFTTGIETELIVFEYLDSFYSKKYNSYFSEFNISEKLFLFQSFVQWKHIFSDNLQLVTGLHHQQIDLNNEIAIEPRLGINWQFKANQKISFGYGKHSQAQNRFVYFIRSLTDPLNPDYIFTNKNLKFSKSHHFVLSYNLLLDENHRIKIETYYQYLYDIPVSRNSSFWSLINYGASFNNTAFLDSLVNNGTAENYGIELTLEKFLNKNLYYLITLSLFNSTYVASDGIERNTMFNGNYVFNILGGYEFELKKHKSLIFDLKGSFAGGTRKIPIDLEKSRESGGTRYDYSRAFEEKFSDYYRIDFKVSYKVNLPKSSHLIALDLSNITNHKNHFVEYYDSAKGEIADIGQIGIIPVILYRVRF